MTAYEIYDRTIKALPVSERLRLAKLILNDLSPDDATLDQDLIERPSAVRDQSDLEALLLAGLDSGPGIEVTPEYWENKRATLLERRAQRA